MIRTLGALMIALCILAFSSACNRGGERSGENATTQVVRDSETARASIAGQLIVPDDVHAAGITIFAEGTSYAAYTDRYGYFELENLRPGRYIVMAMRPDIEPTELGIVDVTDEDTQASQPFADLGEIEVAASRIEQSAFGTSIAGRMGRISGNVVTLSPLDSTDVVVELEGTPFRTVTDDGGEYQFLNIPEGDYVVRFRKRDYRTERRDVTVEAGEEAEVASVTLEPTSPDVVTGGRTIFGRVEMVGSDGEPRTDYSTVTVSLQGTDERARPSSTGEFEFVGLSSSVYTVSAQAPGFLVEQRFQVDLRRIEAAEVTLVLLEDMGDREPLGFLGGQVTLEEADASANGGIQVSLDGTNMSVTTDSEGYFVIEDVPVGTYSLTATMTGYLPGRVNSFSITDDELTTLEPLVLELAAERPRVVSTTPSDGARDVPIDNPTIVVVQFNQRMSSSTVQNAISISPDVSHRIATSGQHPLASDDRAVIVLDGYTRNGTPLRYNTRYTVTVDRSAENTDGLSMRDDHRFSFTTGAAKIVRTVPADGASNAYLDPNRPVRVYFNAKIDPDSISTDNVQVRPSLPANPNVYLQDDPSTGWSFLSISGNFNPDETYTVTVRGRPQTITRGRVTNVPYSFRFTTREAYEWRAPGSEDMRRQRMEEERQRSRR